VIRKIQISGCNFNNPDQPCLWPVCSGIEIRIVVPLLSSDSI